MVRHNSITFHFYVICSVHDNTRKTYVIYACKSDYSQLFVDYVLQFRLRNMIYLK